MSFLGCRVSSRKLFHSLPLLPSSSLFVSRSYWNTLKARHVWSLEEVIRLNGMKRLDLIAVDMSGTLLNDAKELSDENIQALREASEAGVKIALTTGLMTGALEPYDRQLAAAGIDPYYVAFNGGVGRNLRKHGHTPIFEHFLPRDVVDSVVELASSNNWYLNLYSNDTIFSLREHEKRHLADAYAKFVKQPCEFIDSYDQVRDRVPWKLAILSDSEEERNAVHGELFDRFTKRATIMKSIPNMTEVLPPGIDKGTGLRALCKAIGVDLSNTVSFGDAENDVELLVIAHLGVAMRNSRYKALKMSQYVSDFTNNENAVAFEVRKLLKILPTPNRG